MDHIQILNEIIKKGGMFGQVAFMYINDEKQAKEFIKECSKHIKIDNMKEFWGEELVDKIQRYNEKIKL
jgi:hypothetical protein